MGRTAPQNVSPGRRNNSGVCRTRSRLVVDRATLNGLCGWLTTTGSLWWPKRTVESSIHRLMERRTAFGGPTAHTHTLLQGLHNYIDEGKPSSPARLFRAVVGMSGMTGEELSAEQAPGKQQGCWDTEVAGAPCHLSLLLALP